jgi:hypothetical protein
MIIYGVLVSYFRLDDTHFLYERIFFLLIRVILLAKIKKENSNSIALKKIIIDR